MLNVQVVEGYLIQLRFLGNFSYIVTCLKRYNYIKLLQTVYVEEEV